MKEVRLDTKIHMDKILNKNDCFFDDFTNLPEKRSKLLQTKVIWGLN